MKTVRTIDIDKQQKIKDYIDDLVFALYFDVKIADIGIEYAEVIKRRCGKNKFYESVTDL